MANKLIINVVNKVPDATHKTTGVPTFQTTTVAGAAGACFYRVLSGVLPAIGPGNKCHPKKTHTQ